MRAADRLRRRHRCIVISVHHVLIACVVLFASLASVGEAFALAYKARESGGKKVLLAYDCGFIANDPQCPEVHDKDFDGFNAGEETRFRSAWATGPFAEVWLLSGGGSLPASIALARELYARAVTVRVPNRARLRGAGLEPVQDRDGELRTRCISSCTVAFMGGQFRFIDLEPGDEATYEVHAASAVGWNDLDDKQLVERIVALLKAMLEDPDGIAQAIATQTRTTARSLFSLFQDTLWLMLKRRDADDPERRARDRALEIARAPSYRYSESRRVRDREIIKLERFAALQDVLMRIERESMQSAIDELRRDLPSLGRRADVALQMVEAMYGTSSIMETNRMPRETLLKMGYITEFITP